MKKRDAIGSLRRMHAARRNLGVLSMKKADVAMACAVALGKTSGLSKKNFDNIIAEYVKTSRVSIFKARELPRGLDSKYIQKATTQKVVPARIPSELFFKSREWKELRYRVIKTYGPTCMCCGAKAPNVVIQVDHIKPRSLFPEIALDFDNMQVLCEPCNMGKSFIDSTDWRHSSSGT